MKKVIDKNKFGPWAIITGASSGIGKGFARQLAADGLNVILVARRMSLLEESGRQLAKEFGIRYQTIEADLADESAIKKIAEATNDLDIGLLISNAGTGRVGKFITRTSDDLKSTVQLNAISHLMLTHYFSIKFAKRGRGGILLTGAMGAIDGVPYMAAESGTKGFVLSLGRALHHEFRKTGVHITVLETSPTDTAIISKLGFTEKNMPMKALSVKQCVEEALAALSQNKVSIIPGRMYRMINAVVPGSIKRQMTGNIFQNNNNIT